MLRRHKACGRFQFKKLGDALISSKWVFCRKLAWPLFIWFFAYCIKYKTIDVANSNESENLCKFRMISRSIFVKLIGQGDLVQMFVSFVWREIHNPVSAGFNCLEFHQSGSYAVNVTPITMNKKSSPFKSTLLAIRETEVTTRKIMKSQTTTTQVRGQMTHTSPSSSLTNSTLSQITLKLRWWFEISRCFFSNYWFTLV